MEHTPDLDRAIEILAALPPDTRQLALTSLKRWADRDPHTGPFGWLLGLHYTERSADRVRCTVAVDETYANPGKIAHGGVIFTLADSAMGAAVFTRLRPGQRCVTAELKLNYLAPVIRGVVTATATVIHLGQRLAVVTAEVRDERDRLVGLAQGTFAILEAEAARPIGGDS